MLHTLFYCLWIKRILLCFYIWWWCKNCWLSLIEMLILILNAPCCYTTLMILMYLGGMTHPVSDISKWFIYALFVEYDLFPVGFLLFCCTALVFAYVIIPFVFFHFFPFVKCLRFKMVAMHIVCILYKLLY